MSLLQHVADGLTLPRHPSAFDRQREQYDSRDIHQIDTLLGDTEYLDDLLSPRASLRFSRMGSPRLLKRIPHMGKVWDYRAFTSSNGGTIHPSLHVEHIPVIRQMDGRADLDVLWRVLVNQGLMVHNGSDGEGNVALFVGLDKLCYHARGANTVSVGTEHMHYAVSDAWSSRQLNAAAYLSYRSKEHASIPMYNGKLDDGNGYVVIRRQGHVTHKRVSDAAGYHDRSDPGDKYVALMGEIRERAIFFRAHHRF